MTGRWPVKLRWFPLVSCGRYEPCHHAHPNSGDQVGSKRRRIAYQVVSENPRDILFIPGFIANVEQMWELPGLVRITGEILVSSTVKDLVVGCGIDFVDPAAFRLSGVPGDWHVWTVTA